MKQKKRNKFQVLMSSAALLLILVISAGVTFSWIEGGSSFMINGAVRTAKAPSASVVNSLTINPDVDSTISLNQFDKNINSEGLYFSEVSSDGENFFFPTAYDNNTPSAYREAVTNDIGAKFIKYDFDVNVSGDCVVMFKQTPKITVKNRLDEIIDVETSAFRIMLKCDKVKKVFTTDGSETTTDIVVDENGTKAKLSAEPVSRYVVGNDNSKYLFQLRKGENKKISVSVWLDAASEKPIDLLGAKIDLDMQLKAAPSTCYLMSSKDNWGDGEAMVDEGNGIYSVTVELKKNTSYEFKVKYGDVWYTNKGYQVNNSVSDIDFSNVYAGLGNNAIINTGVCGDYKFIFNSNTKKLTVKFPYIYLRPSQNWKSKDNSRYAVYLYKENSNPAEYEWISMSTAIEGDYKVIVPGGKGYTHVIFCNMYGDRPENNWDNKRYQSADIELPDYNKNLFILYDDWNYPEGEWDIKEIIPGESAGGDKEEGGDGDFFD